MALEGIFLLAALAEVERALRRESFLPMVLSVYFIISMSVCYFRTSLGPSPCRTCYTFLEIVPQEGSNTLRKMQNESSLGEVGHKRPERIPISPHSPG